MRFEWSWSLESPSPSIRARRGGRHAPPKPGLRTQGGKKLRLDRFVRHRRQFRDQAAARQQDLPGRLSGRRCARRSGRCGRAGGPSSGGRRWRDTRARSRAAGAARALSAMRAMATARRQASLARGGGRDAAAADEGELRGLADDAAPGRRIAARAGAVQHHLGDRELAFQGLAARLEIDGAGEAILLGGERCRRRHGVRRARPGRADAAPRPTASRSAPLMNALTDCGITSWARAGFAQRAAAAVKAMLAPATARARIVRIMFYLLLLRCSIPARGPKPRRPIPLRRLAPAAGSKLSAAPAL